MNKPLLLLLISSILFTSHAGLGLAVIRDKDTHSLGYGYAYLDGPSWKASDAAKKEAEKYAKKQGWSKKTHYDYIYKLSGNEKYGHNINSGYVVIVRAQYKSNGKMKTSYGLGGSANSYREAEERAIKHLSTYDWSWRKSNGHSIEKRFKF